MPYSVSLPDGRTVQFPDNVSHEQAASIIKQQLGDLTPPPPEPTTSTGGAFGHGILQGILPSAAGIIAGGAGAAAGAAAGPVGTVIGGLAAGTAASSAVSAAQEAFLKDHPHFADFLGLSEEQRAAEEKTHPYASMAGEIAPNLLAFRPSTQMFRSIASAATPEAKAAITAARINAGINVGIGGGMEAGQEAMGDQPMDPTRIALAAAGAGLGQKETGIGRRLTGIGEGTVDAAARKTLDLMRRPKPAEATGSIAPDSSLLAPTEAPPVEQKSATTVAMPDGSTKEFTHGEVLDAMRKFPHENRTAQNVANTLGIDKDSALDLMRDMRKSGVLNTRDAKPGKARYEIVGEEQTGAANAPAGTERGAAGTSDAVPVPPTGAEGAKPAQPVGGGVEGGGRPANGVVEGTRTNLDPLTEQQAKDLNAVADPISGVPKDPPAKGESTPAPTGEKPPVVPTAKPVGELEAKLPPEIAAEYRKFFSDNNYEQPDDIGEAGYFSWNHDTPLADGKSKIIGIVEPGQYDRDEVIHLPIKSSNPNIGASILEAVSDRKGGYLPKLVWEIYSNKLDSNGHKIGSPGGLQEQMDAEIRNKIVGPELYDRITKLNPNNYRTKIDLITDINKILREHAASVKPTTGDVNGRITSTADTRARTPPLTESQIAELKKGAPGERVQELVPKPLPEASDKSNELQERIAALIDETHSARHDSLSNLKDRVMEATSPEELKQLEEEVARHEALPVDAKEAPQPILKPGMDPDYVSSQLQQKLMAGDLQGAIEHLAADDNESGRNPLSRALAKIINRVGRQGYGGKEYGKETSRTKKFTPFKNVNINVEGAKGYDPKPIEALRAAGNVAMYDARTNTIHVTREGLTDQNILHEAVHAVTTRVLSDFEKTGGKNLSEAQKFGAQRVNDIFKHTLVRAALAKDFPDAFKNVYEFVSHAMTDRAFQERLAKISIPESGYTTNRGEYRSSKQAGRYSEKAEIANTEMMQQLEEKISKLNPLAKTYESQKERLEQLLAEAREDAENIAIRKAAEARPDTGRTIGRVIGSVWNAFTNAVKEMLGIKGKGAGNVMLELSQAFPDLLKAPTKVSGIEPLFAKRREGVTVKAPPFPKFVDTPAGREAAALHVIGGKNEALQNTLENINKKKSWYERFQNAVIAMQSDRRLLKDLEDSLINSGMAKYDKDGNLVYSAVIRSTGIAADNDARYIKPHNHQINEGIQEYTKAKGLTPQQALARLDAYYMAIHEPERRLVNFIKKAPLDNERGNAFELTYPDGTKRMDTAAGHRGYIDEYLKQYKDLVTSGEAKKLRSMLDEIVFKKDPLTGKIIYDAAGKPIINEKYVKADGFSVARQNKKPMSIDMNHEDYSVIGGYTKQAIDGLREMYEKDLKNPATANALNKITTHMKMLHDNTNMLNRRANFFTPQVANMVDFYGWKHYVPFKGRPDEVGARQAALNEEFELGTSKKFGSGYSDNQEEFGGRKSDSSNTLLQSMADGVQASLRVGRADVTKSIKNLIDDFPSLGRRVKFPSEEGGEPIDTIKFKDRAKAGEHLAASKGTNRFFHYMPNGDIQVYEFNPQNAKYAEAIRRSYMVSNDLINKGIDQIGKVTKTVSMAHTRFNVAFAPFNFIRHAFTNTTAIMAHMGAAKGSQFLGRVMNKIADGKLLDTYNFARMYENGEFDKLDRLAKTDPYIANLMEFIKQGGRTSWLEGLTTKSKYNDVLKDVKMQGGIAKTAEQVSKIADHYGDMFELTSRACAYETSKEFEVERFVKEKGRQPTAEELNGLKQQAAAFTKELINYEHSGTYGRQLGSLFSFWRANATGAVRAMDALMPAFMTSPAEFIKQLPPDLQHDVQMKKGIDAFKAKNNREPNPAELAQIAKSDAVVKAKQATDKLTARFVERQKTARILIASLVGAGMVAYNMSYLMAGQDDEGRNAVATDDHSMWTRSWRIPVGKDAMGKDNNFVQIPWGFGGGALAGIGAQMMAAIYGHTDAKDLSGNVVTLLRDSYLPIPAAEFNVMDDPMAWTVDSIMPSVFRPIVEYKMNKDTFGRQIHNANMSKFGGIYEGGDYVPQIYQSAARHLAEITNGYIMWEPTSIHFFASNFTDGWARMAQTATDIGMGVTGQKDIDPKMAMLPFGNFIGKKTSFDSREYAKAEQDIKQQRDILNSFSTRPELYRAYVAAHPNAPAIVATYDKINNGPLKKIRETIHQMQSSDQPPADYAERVRYLRQVQERVMRTMTDYYDTHN